MCIRDREYIDRFRTLAKSVAACQQPEGYWTRSMLDPQHAPGPVSYTHLDVYKRQS